MTDWTVPPQLFIDRLARFGWLARGAVYLGIGVIAALAASGSGEATGSRGALVTLLSQPFGRVLLAIVSLGLVAYAVWLGIQTFVGSDASEARWQDLVVRASRFVTALAHAMLALFGLRLLVEGRSLAEPGRTEAFAEMLMQQVGGRWWVTAVGVAILASALAEFHWAGFKRFRERMDFGEDVAVFAVPICQFGLAARGVVFAVVGVLFVLAGTQADPERAGGVSQALTVLHEQAYGRYLLGGVALGMIAFAGFSLFEARYRRVEIRKRDASSG